MENPERVRDAGMQEIDIKAQAHRRLPPVQMILICLAVLFLAASAYRHNGLGAALSWIALGVLPLLGRSYAWRMLALGLALGAGQWLWLARDFIAQRQAFGAPYLRLLLILSALAGLSLVAAAMAYRQGAGRHGQEKGGAAPVQRACAWAAWIACLGLVALSVLPAKHLLLGSRFLPDLSVGQAVLMGALAGRVCELLLSPQAAVWRVRLWLAFSAWFFTQLALGLTVDPRFLMTGSLHVPVPAVILGGPLYRMGGFFMLGLFSVSVLLAGPAWCSQLCYFGAFDSALARRKARPTKGLARRSRFRVWALAATVAVALALRYAGVETWVAAGCALGFGAVGVLFFGPASARSGVSLHCLSYCPMGLVSSVLGRLSPWRLTVAQGCTNCGRCVRACRHAALEDGDLKRGRAGSSCTLCGDCLRVCANGLTSMSFAGMRGAWVLPAHKAVLAVLWTLFVAVARV